MSQNIKTKGTAQGERKDKHVEVPDAVPNAETFDLDDFVQQKSTVPVVKVTVFLDADSGKQLYEAYQKRDDLVAAESELSNAPKPKLAVGESNPNMVRLDSIQKDLNLVKETITTLEDRVRSSALLIEFQITDHKMPQRVREATAKVLDIASGDDSSINEEDEQLLSEKSMTAMMAQSVVRITRTDGKTINGPISIERMENLRNKLVVTEATKLIQGLYEALNLNVEWMSNLDAGFPG